MTNAIAYPITDKQSWLENRLLDVTSTEVSALFGLSPYKTKYELYNEKKDKVVINIEDNQRMAWGRRLEDSIAHGCADMMGWKVEQFDLYMSDPDLRMGSSFDYKITSEKELGILEVKNVDRLAFLKSWIEHDDGTVEAPPHIELQLHHQMAVANINWGCICALVGGNELKTVILKRNPKIEEEIKSRIKEFWQLVKSGTPPEIDFNRDSTYIIRNSTAQDDLGMVADEDVEKIIDQYVTLNRSIKDDEKERDKLKAQIFERSQGASKIISKYGNVNCGMTKGSKGKLITQEMVGTYINGRNPYRQLRITQPKPQGANK